ncbi:hypothetical protein O181_014543 [Austropuccinia psidii MF-1]|uniref:Uncharacterized protein n=1 Tax=Austropuccinia psidii MF-1 TaxID=1389203 RepID=A0A9Q3C0R2_9BASI|nr:hypothetical protein [Austropuccinia psidii MF-1]
MLPDALSQKDTIKRSYGNHQRMKYQQEVLTHGGKGSHYKGELSHYPSYRKETEPERAYSHSPRLTSSRPTQPSSGFTPFREQQISAQVPILHNGRYFPEQEKDQRARTRLLSTKHRKSQTQ